MGSVEVKHDQKQKLYTRKIICMHDRGQAIATGSYEIVSDKKRNSSAADLHTTATKH